MQCSRLCAYAVPEATITIQITLTSSPKTSIAVRAAAPLAVARRSGQQQYDQHHDRSDENRYDESAQKTQTTLAAAQPGEKAEYEIYNDAYRYGHYAIALLIPLLSVTVRG